MTTSAPAPAPLDFTRLTLGEIAKLEELTGLSIDRIASADAPKGKLLAAMAYVASRRRGTPLSFDEALGLSIPETNELLGLTELTAGADDVDDVDDDEEEEADEGNR